MEQYQHKINYYETDKMGITHHSNYIRFMEEARMDFLSRIGYPMTRLEEEGITSPVVSVSCQYKKTTTYDDILKISVRITAYNGVKLSLSYEMKNVSTGEIAATAQSTHCFIDGSGAPISVRRRAPVFDQILQAEMQNDWKE